MCYPIPTDFPDSSSANYPSAEGGDIFGFEHYGDTIQWPEDLDTSSLSLHDVLNGAVYPPALPPPFPAASQNKLNTPSQHPEINSSDLIFTQIVLAALAAGNDDTGLSSPSSSSSGPAEVVSSAGDAPLTNGKRKERDDDISSQIVTDALPRKRTRVGMQVTPLRVAAAPPLPPLAPTPTHQRRADNDLLVADLLWQYTGDPSILCCRWIKDDSTICGVRGSAQVIWDHICTEHRMVHLALKNESTEISHCAETHVRAYKHTLGQHAELSPKMPSSPKRTLQEEMALQDMPNHIPPRKRQD
ncbi:hypothetical protein C8Q72DRAFT_883979 [Fomitopsis betulina]|nr:hypothetical protein C8Q72DRAFT_883979 [Fomitopsis betulina]